MLDCFTQSRAFPQTTPPSLCILHTLSTKQNTPLISSTTSRLKSPRGDFTKTPTPGRHPAVSHTRTHPYRIYRAPVRLWRGCSALSLSSCVSSLACQARERARALPSLSSSFCLAVSHPITGTRLKGPLIALSRARASIGCYDGSDTINTNCNKPARPVKLSESNLLAVLKKVVYLTGTKRTTQKAPPRPEATTPQHTPVAPVAPAAPVAPVPRPVRDSKSAKTGKAARRAHRSDVPLAD